MLKWGQVFNLPTRKPGVPAAPGGMPAATSKHGVQGGNPQVKNLRPLSGRNLRRLKTCGHEKPAATCRQGERGAARARETAFVSSASQDDEAEETPSERRAGCPQRASGDGHGQPLATGGVQIPIAHAIGLPDERASGDGHGQPLAAGVVQIPIAHAIGLPDEQPAGVMGRNAGPLWGRAEPLLNCRASNFAPRRTARSRARHPDR
jgi:hypothetical protein